MEVSKERAEELLRDLYDVWDKGTEEETEKVIEEVMNFLKELVKKLP